RHLLRGVGKEGVKEPVGVVQLLDPFRIDDAPPVPEGYRAVAEVVRPGLGEVLRVAAVVEREDARIVHGVGSRALPVAVAAARLVRARSICSISHAPSAVAEALACRAADAVVVPSEGLRLGPKMRVVPPWADLARFGASQ